jgi:tRNA (guanine10-N2)-dimethyltransferase
MQAYVELAGEAIELARAEVAGAAEAVGGSIPPYSEGSADLVEVDLPSDDTGRRFADRLAMSRRCVVRLGPIDQYESVARVAAATHATAAVRRFGRPSSGSHDPQVQSFGRAYVEGGGQIDLDRPQRRFWLSAEGVYEEVGRVDRSAVARRRMPALPFQRPVSLPPRFARAAANLARVRSGDRVVDPFLGTGALLAEAGLLGARLFGLDRDPSMVRGALQNLSHLGLAAEELVVGDAGSADLGSAGPTFDAVLTDPPYGRSSSTGGEAAAELVARVLPRWAERVRPGGRVVVVVGDGSEPLGPSWERRVSVPVRVHRSLTREFRVYERAVGPTTNPG